MSDRKRIMGLALIDLLSDYPKVHIRVLNYLLSQEKTRDIAYKLLVGNLQELRAEEFSTILDASDIHAKLGESFLRIGRNQEEPSCLLLATEFFKKARAEGLIQGSQNWAGSLLNQGIGQQTLAELGMEQKRNLWESLELYERARLEGFQRGTIDWARSLMNQGVALQALAELGVEQKEYLEMAVELQERARSEGFQRGTPSWAMSLMNQGVTHSILAAFGVKQKENLGIAVELQERARSEGFQSGTPSWAMSLMNQGTALKTLADLGVEQEKNLWEALELYEKAREEGFQRGTPDWAILLVNQGVALQALAELGLDPEENLVETLELFERAREEGLQSGTPSWARSLMNQGVALQTLAELGVEQEKNLRRAVELQKKARAEGFQRGTPEWANSLVNQGVALQTLADLGVEQEKNLWEALELNEKARKEGLQRGTPEWAESLVNQGVALNSLADLGVEQEKNLWEAIRFYERAREEGLKRGTPNWASLILNQGNALKALADLGVEQEKNLWEALELYEKAREEGFQRGTPDWAGSLINQGIIFQSLADLGVEKEKNLWEAIRFYERAREEGLQRGTPRWADSLAFEGALKYTVNRLNEAYRVLKDATEIIETLRIGMLLPESRRGYTERVTNIYSTMALTCLKLGKNEEAFSYAEAVKGRTFYEQLASDKKTLESHPELLDEREKLQTKIRHLEATIHRPIDPRLSDNTKNRIKAQKMRDQKTRESLIDEYERLMLRIKEADPEYYGVATSEPIPLKELQNLLQDITLIEYLFGRDEVWAFIINQELTVKKLETTAIQLAEEVIEVRRTLDHYGKLSKRLGRALENGDNASASKYRREMIDTVDECDRILGGLYDKLIMPLEGLSKRVIIVPHWLLHHLPFLALKGDQYLVEEHLVGFAQSATSLRYGNESAHRKEVISALIVGNPSGDLEYGEKEALKIGEMFDEAPLIGNQATVENVFQNMRGKNLLHFSCHGEYDWIRPGFSGLVLSDGMLKAVDFMDMELSAELAVLSACETGLGDVNRGDEVEGLVRAVQYAGVGDVVASLWSVFDASTLELFRRFYDEWRREGDVVASLCEAVVSMIEDPSYSVYHWAPFQAYTNKHQ